MRAYNAFKSCSRSCSRSSWLSQQRFAPIPTPARTQHHHPRSTVHVRASTSQTATSSEDQAIRFHHAQLANAPTLEGMEHLPYYSQYPLDRKAEWRRDSEQLSHLFSHPHAKLLLITRDKCMVTEISSSTETSSAPAPPSNNPAQPTIRPVLMEPAAPAAAAYAKKDAPHVFLGVDANGHPYFATEAADPEALVKEAGPSVSWRGARLAGPDLGAGDAALVAVATSLLQWHKVGPGSCGWLRGNSKCYSMVHEKLQDTWSQ